MKKKAASLKRIRGRALQRIRREMIAKDPRCAMCRRILAGIDWHVDHIQALVNGGEDAPENRQLLCAPCHEKKTRKDLGQRPEIGLDGWPAE